MAVSSVAFAKREAKRTAADAARFKAKRAKMDSPIKSSLLASWYKAHRVAE